MSTKLRSPVVAALLLLLPMTATLVATPVAAQMRAATAPWIETMTIESDAGLDAGATLRFDVYGTPEARSASVRLGDSGITVPLRERSDGHYAGSYVVRRADRLDARDPIAVRLTHGDRTFAREFAYPASLQAAAPAPVPSAQIERLVMRPMGRLQAGQQLRFRLNGAPGGDAWVDIPGVLERLDLAETRPGVYEGSYTIRRRDDLDAFRNAEATLRNGNQRATARLDLGGRDRYERAGRGDRRDGRAPQISDMSPANGERVSERGRTRISARLSDEGAGVDPASVRLRLAGRDVTSDARISTDEVQYRADLEPGRYTAEVRATDRAGNTTTTSWTFDVGDARVGVPPPGARPVPPPPAAQLPPVPLGPLTLAVTSHANGATVIDDGKLTLVGRTAPMGEVRVQVDSISSGEGTVGVAQKVLDQVVRADAYGNFEVAVTPSGFVIPGSRYEVRMSAARGSQVVTERLTLHRRQS